MPSSMMLARAPSSFSSTSGRLLRLRRSNARNVGDQPRIAAKARWKDVVDAVVVWLVTVVCQGATKIDAVPLLHDECAPVHCSFDE